MIRVFEAFAGYGSQSIALRNLAIEHEVVAISEIDKYAIQAYESIHGPTNNLGDICKIDPKDIPQHDLFTYSFPCQDLSVAGKQAGLGEGTRSGLLYECEKIIEHCRPKYLLLENVKNLVGKKFKADFDKWLEYLEGLGYTNYWQVLNAKNYGVPQNRERVFVISILGEHEPYKFADKMSLDECIADILEEEVAEKYYLPDDRVKNMMLSYKDDYKKKSFDEIQQITYPKFSQQRVYSCNGIAPTIAAGNNGGGKEPCKIMEYKIYQNVKVRKYDVDIDELKKTLRDAKNKSGLTINDISSKLGKSKTTVEHWFRNDDCFSIPDECIWLDLKKLLGITTDKFDKSIMEFEIKPNEYDMSNRVYHENGIAPTLTATGESGAKKIICEQRCDEGLRFFKGNVCGTIRTIDAGGDKRVIEEDFKIRKLTPRECFRLMGMRDDDIDKIQAVGISNTQQYKMAGNSIVINVLEVIFKNLF